MENGKVLFILLYINNEAIKLIRVAIVLEDFSIGGAQRVVSELVQHIDAQKVKLLVLCLWERSDTALAEAAEKVADVRYLGIHGKNLIANYFRISKILRSFHPDIVHAHLVGQLYAVPWGLLNHVPVLITAHTKPRKAFIKKIEWLIRYGVNHKKIWIAAVSQENLDLVKDYFPGAEKQCLCINNGINIHSFYRKEHADFTFINVARQDENKNQMAILRAFHCLYLQRNDIKLILAGDGPCHEKLAAEVKKMGLDQVVLLPGKVDQVSDYYAVADVYVQSSHREAMPMSVLEALAAGLPIISTDVGGLHDVVKGNGILCPDYDGEAIYQAMKRLLFMSSGERKLMIRGSQNISKNYSSDKMAKRYESVYCEVIENVNKS